MTSLMTQEKTWTARMFFSLFFSVLAVSTGALLGASRAGHVVQPRVACSTIRACTDNELAPRERGPKLGRMSPAARTVLDKLDKLRPVRNAIDTEGLGRILRSGDAQALNGQVLLQVLLSLKQTGQWELATNLAAMVEASAPDTTPAASWDLTAQAQQYLDTGAVPADAAALGVDAGAEDEDEGEEAVASAEVAEALAQAEAAEEAAEEAWFAVEEDDFEDEVRAHTAHALRAPH